MKKNYTSAILFFLFGLAYHSSFAQLVAVDDTVSVTELELDAIIIPNVLANDTFNGNPVDLSMVSITQIAQLPFPYLTLEADGSVKSVGGGEPGTYVIVYQICDLSNPTVCETAIVTVSVGNIADTAFIGSIVQPTCANPTAEVTLDHLYDMYNPSNWILDIYVNGLIFGTFEGNSPNFTVSNIPPGLVQFVVSNINDALRFAQVQAYIPEPENCGPDGIRLIAFLDNNGNGIKDASELFFNYGSYHIEANNSGVPNHIYSLSGQYTLFDSNPTNSYDIFFTTYNDGCNGDLTSTAVFNGVNIAAGSGIIDYYFPIVSLPCTNLDIVLFGSSTKPGSTYRSYIRYRNLGTQTIASGTITYTKPNVTTIDSVNNPSAIVSANGCTLDFTNLTPGQWRVLTVTLSVPNIPVVNIGDQLVSTASITIPPGDNFPANNTDTYTSTIVAAYDPNDIHESHNGKILISDFTSDDFLTYTIRFENTGNAEADHIVVTDLLDPMLDEESIEMVTASGNYILDRVSNNLVWTFDNINLPPSIPDSDIGKGYIVFKIKPQPGYAIGDIIPNSADIYFDTNPAITTNTWTTEFVATLATNKFDQNEFSVYPNPTNKQIHISMQKSNIDEVIVVDISGKTMFAEKPNALNVTLDLSQLSAGMYFAKVKSAGKEKVIKLIKE